MTFVHRKKFISMLQFSNYGLELTRPSFLKMRGSPTLDQRDPEITEIQQTGDGGEIGIKDPDHEEFRAGRDTEYTHFDVPWRVNELGIER